jgi:LysR family transcriptional activator of nhaA
MDMEWLNYHHLLYFWVVAREGSVTKAAVELRLGQPTISAQLRSLEESLGQKLFRRAGRNLVLTDAGREVLRYADEIFSLGRELLATVRGRQKGAIRFVVGISDALPKLVAYRLLQPALALPEPIRMICRQDKAERLLAELTTHSLDLVLSDAPLAPGASIKAFTHLLGECGVSFCATAKLARVHRRGFPRSLDAAPLVLPTDNTTVRVALDRWFDEQKIRPRVVAECEDGALLKAFGQNGLGIFPVPTITENDVRKQYGVEVVGRVEAIRERFYAISLERRLRHPAVAAITQAAREKLFG